MGLSLFCVKRIVASKKTLVAALASMSLVVSGATACTPLTKTAEENTFLMDTIISQKWHGVKADEAVDAIDAALKEIEEQINLYSDSSEIAKINAAAGKEYVQVSDNVFEMLYRAKELCAESGGIYDITIAPLSLLWDITGDDPHVPTQDEIDEAKSKVDYSKLLLDEETHSVMLAEEGMMLDLGGTAKGMAASVAVEIAKEYEVQGFISIGGNVAVVGKNPDGSEIQVALRDPLGDQNSYMATLNIDGYTMATSNATERYFEQDGVIYHHILNPFTGYPGESDLMSVTVISEDGLLADTLSTTIYLRGTEALDEYLERDDCMVIAITNDCTVYGSEKVWQILTPYNTQDYEFINE